MSKWYCDRSGHPSSATSIFPGVESTYARNTPQVHCNCDAAYARSAPNATHSPDTTNAAHSTDTPGAAHPTHTPQSPSRAGAANGANAAYSTAARQTG